MILSSKEDPRIHLLQISFHYGELCCDYTELALGSPDVKQNFCVKRRAAVPVEFRYHKYEPKVFVESS